MITEALDHYVRASAIAMTDRGNTVGASEIGMCARRVFFAKNEADYLVGKERDADFAESWGATLRGSLIEEHLWLPAMRAKYGDKLLFAGTEQRTFKSALLSATPDGLLIDQPRDSLAPLGVPDMGTALVVECKSADPRVKLDQAKPEHAYQIQVQIGLIRELTSYRPEFGLIAYINASFLSEVVEFPIAFDPAVFETAKERATRVMTATRADELRPEGWIAGGKECEFCPFVKACGVILHAVPTDGEQASDPQFVAEIADAARTIKSLEASVDRDCAQLRSLQEGLKERLRERGHRRIVGDGVSVVWSPVKGRQSWDAKGIREAAEKAGVNISEFETSGEPTDRLVIRITQARCA